jgi:hypothetical protein
MRSICFCEDMARAITEGRKRATTRSMSNTLRVGETVSARLGNRFGPQFTLLRITGIVLIRPELYAWQIAQAEGFETPGAYLAKLRVLNPGIDLMAEHKLITFERIDDGEEVAG